MKTSKLVRITGLDDDTWKDFQLLIYKQQKVMSRVIAQWVIDYLNKHSTIKPE